MATTKPNRTKCPSCGVPWVKHMGIIHVCSDKARLMQISAGLLRRCTDHEASLALANAKIERLQKRIKKLT
jgi:hypothetical protein